jgi:hypothetical protein
MISAKFILCIFLGLIPFSTTFHSISAQNTDPVQSKLFEDDEVLELKLTGDIKDLMRDRGDSPSYHQETLTLINSGSDEEVHQIKVKVRGNFRRLKSNCDHPPLTLNFDKDEIPESSIFYGQNKLKLVVPCNDEMSGIKEYLVYKMYNLITPYSFKVRLVKLFCEDTEHDKEYSPQFGFIIEDEDALAHRHQAEILARDRMTPQHMLQEEFLKMSVFAYMIGNTDWSTQYRHNTKLLYKKSANCIISVPYDFDLCGIVGNSYAKPAEELRLRSVKKRRFRGHCLEDLNILLPIFHLFNQVKPEIYKLYQDVNGLSEKYNKNAIKYLDEFFQIINDPSKWKKDFSYPCDPYGTGNVVISGMKKG